MARASQALNDTGFPATVEVLVVATPEEAESVGFHGSPTLLTDRHEPSPAPHSPAWAGRLYPTEEGLEGAPWLIQLREALRR